MHTCVQSDWRSHSCRPRSAEYRHSDPPVSCISQRTFSVRVSGKMANLDAWLTRFTWNEWRTYALRSDIHNGQRSVSNEFFCPCSCRQPTAATYFRQISRTTRPVQILVQARSTFISVQASGELPPVTRKQISSVRRATSSQGVTELPRDRALLLDRVSATDRREAHWLSSSTRVCSLVRKDLSNFFPVKKGVEIDLCLSFCSLKGAETASPNAHFIWSRQVSLLLRDSSEHSPVSSPVFLPIALVEEENFVWARAGPCESASSIHPPWQLSMGTSWWCEQNRSNSSSKFAKASGSNIKTKDVETEAFGVCLSLHGSQEIFLQIGQIWGTVQGHLDLNHWARVLSFLLSSFQIITKIFTEFSARPICTLFTSKRSSHCPPWTHYLNETKPNNLQRTVRRYKAGLGPSWYLMPLWTSETTHVWRKPISPMLTILFFWAPNKQHLKIILAAKIEKSSFLKR